MFEITDNIVNFFISNQLIDPEDREIYQFGVGQGLNLILNVLSSLAVGLILGMVWESLLFLTAYMPLRSYAGGYHARTKLRCYLYSLFLVAVSLSAVRYIGSEPWFMAFSLIPAAVIWALAPVENEKKPLNGAEFQEYRRRTRILLLSEAAVGAVLWRLGFWQASACAAASVWAIMVMVTVERGRKIFAG